jgi:hypothetical protein
MNHVVSNPLKTCGKEHRVISSLGMTDFVDTPITGIPHLFYGNYLFTTEIFKQPLMVNRSQKIRR